MHSKGIYHRDIKPENILLDSDFNIKLADFGFATHDTSSNSRYGTEGYMSPELMLNKEYNPWAADLFASAIVLFIMKTGHPPFLTATAADPYFKLLAANRSSKFWYEYSKVHEEDLGFFGDDFMDLLTGMFQYNPKQRYSMAEIMTHPWVQGETATLEEIKVEFTRR